MNAVLDALLCLVALPLSITLFNLFTWRRGSVTPPPPGRVSVLIPARNEAVNIEAAVRSVLTTSDPEHVIEILVLDDGSTDGTAEIVKRIQAFEPRVQLISGKPLAPGWVGKPHACQALFDHAKGDTLLFMDADVRLKPSGLLRLLSLKVAPVQGRIVTAVPAQEMGSFIERLLIPLLAVTYMAWLPLRLIEVGKNPKTVAANGQLLLIAAADLRAMGGFHRVKNAIVDDMAFCKHAKSLGLKVVFADASLMAECRMYRTPDALIAGFSKNLHEGLGSTFALAAAGLLYLTAFVVPYIALAWALSLLAMGNEPPAWLLPAAIGTGLNLILRATLALRFGHSLVSVLLHPLSVMALLAIAANSWRWSASGTINWAGRTYAPQRLRSTTSLAEETP